MEPMPVSGSFWKAIRKCYARSESCLTLSAWPRGCVMELQSVSTSNLCTAGSCVLLRRSQKRTRSSSKFLNPKSCPERLRLPAHPRHEFRFALSNCSSDFSDLRSFSTFVFANIIVESLGRRQWRRHLSQSDSSRRLLRSRRCARRRRLLSRRFQFQRGAGSADSSFQRFGELDHHRTRLAAAATFRGFRSEEHTSELQSLAYLVCRLLLEKKKKNNVRYAFPV